MKAEATATTAEPRGPEPEPMEVEEGELETIPVRRSLRELIPVRDGQGERRRDRHLRGGRVRRGGPEGNWGVPVRERGTTGRGGEEIGGRELRVAEGSEGVKGEVRRGVGCGVLRVGGRGELRVGGTG